MSVLIDSAVKYLRTLETTYWQTYSLDHHEELVYLSSFGHVHIAMRFGSNLRVCFGNNWTKLAREDYGNQTEFEPVAFRVTNSGESLRENVLPAEQHQFSLSVRATLRKPLPPEIELIEPKTVAKTNKKPKCKDLMAAEIVPNPSALLWTAREWQENLPHKFSVSTITSTPTWKLGMAAKLKRDAENELSKFERRRR